jgi:hypothetical protein
MQPRITIQPLRGGYKIFSYPADCSRKADRNCYRWYPLAAQFATAHQRSVPRDHRAFSFALISWILAARAKHPVGGWTLGRLVGPLLRQVTESARSVANLGWWFSTEFNLASPFRRSKGDEAQERGGDHGSMVWNAVGVRDRAGDRYLACALRQAQGDAGLWCGTPLA